MPGTEIALSTGLSTVLREITTTSASILGQLRAGSTIRQAERAILTGQMNALRAQHAAEQIAMLANNDIHRLLALYAPAERHAGDAKKYELAMGVVHRASVDLADNAADFARSIRYQTR